MKTLSLSLTALACALSAGGLAAPNAALAQDSTTAQAAQVATSSPRDDLLSAGQIREELSITRLALEQIHPGYTRYTQQSVFDALWDEVEAELLANPTRGNLYLQISRVLATIRCDHTKAELPKDFEAARQSEPLYLPIRYAIFDGRMFVTNPGTTDLAVGSEVLAIDGVPVSAAIRAVNALFPVDGDTDYVKEESIANFDEFMGPAFEHFYPFLYETSEDVALTIAGGETGTQAIATKRLGFTDYAAITGEKRFSRNFKDAVTFKLLDDRSAYLSVDTFVNYRAPVDPDTLYAPIFAELERSGRDTLILDLRRNGGGSNDAQMGLLTWLMTKDFREADALLVKSDTLDPELKPYLGSWEKAALNPDPAWFKKREDGMFEIINPLVGKPAESIAAKDGAFTGKLIVLTSGDNASGVTHLLATLRTQRDNAVFVGEPTGGAATGATAGILFYLTLPHSGVKVRVPLQRTLIAYADQLNPRGGITPDILAPDTRFSTLAGTDPAMEAALAYIAKDK
ncbi:MAG: S41 family peptidase [Pseudomonadota bacterium]